MTLRRLLCFALVLGFASPSFAQPDVSETNKLFTARVLKETLPARTPAEQQFCDYVIRKRDDGTIPPQFVYGVYRIAMTKEKSRRFMYFKTGLETLCKREGIALNSLPVSTPSPSPSLNTPSLKVKIPSLRLLP
jgi:hypothetical protein